VGAGSVYAIEVKDITYTKISLTQDNGQEIVVHYNNLDELIEKLTELKNKE
jgi:hypothetical protein